jgi:hypothetical protein
MQQHQTALGATGLDDVCAYNILRLNLALERLCHLLVVQPRRLMLGWAF